MNPKQNKTNQHKENELTKAIKQKDAYLCTKVPSRY